MQYKTETAVFCAFLILIFTRVADAYIDPGSGSYILQLLVATFFGALFALKIYWKKMKSFFRGSRQDSNDNTEQKPN